VACLKEDLNTLVKEGRVSLIYFTLRRRDRELTFYQGVYEK